MRKVIAVGWTLLIVALCTLPGGSLPEVRLFSADKIGHLVMFAGFAWLWLWATRAETRRAAFYVVAVGIMFAAGTELYQGVLPFDRDPSVLDALADVAGVLFGVWMYRTFARRRAQVAQT